MRLNHGLLALAWLCLCGCASESGEAPSAGDAAADTVYTNGRIYTVNESQPWAEAVAIQGGKFLVVGSNADVEAVTGDGTEVVDLGGRFAMPGLVDTHTHPFVDGIKQLGSLSFDFESVEPTLEEMQRQVAAYAEANPDREWIFGGMWPRGSFPARTPCARTSTLSSRTGRPASWIRGATPTGATRRRSRSRV